MKLRTISGLLLVLFSAFGWTSCGQEAPEALSLHEVENNAIQLYYGSKGGVTIRGGDGRYAFSCESPLLKAEMTYGNYILFEPQGVGEAVVQITDASGGLYVLNVSIGYRTEDIVIAEVEAKVVGEALTEDERAELSAKALESVPVKAGGGYHFVYTHGEEGDEVEGALVVYPDTHEHGGVEGVFKRVIARNDDGSFSFTYALRYRDENRVLLLEHSQPAVKTSPVEPRIVRFVEDLTERYQSDYPGAVQVYTLQLIGRMRTV
jgi:hypothetical protein